MIVSLILFVTYLIIASVHRERAKKRIIEIREGKGTASLAQAGLMLFGMPAIGSTVDYRKFISALSAYHKIF